MTNNARSDILEVMINTAEQIALTDRLSRKAKSVSSIALLGRAETAYDEALAYEREAYTNLMALIDNMEQKGELTWEEAKKARDSIWGAPSY